LAVLAALLLSGCHLMASHKTGPEGRSMHDTDLRQLARDEAFVEALDLTDPDDRGDIGDELLRLMHRGLLLHYAGQYEESNEVLQRAEAIIDDRYTRSVSLALLSIVTSDRALAWLPSDTERLMVNYYGALNYLALGDPEEAAVEARRLSRLLELGEEDDLEPDEVTMRELLRYFAGSVFEASGNRNDAAVAYRHVWSPAETIGDSPLQPRFLDLYGEDWVEENPPQPKQDFDTALDSIMAELAGGAGQGAAADSIETVEDSLENEELDVVAAMGLPTVEDDDPDPALPDDLQLTVPSDSGEAPAVPDSLVEPPHQPPERGGDVVVLLEHGFVAHRVERSLNVPLFPVEADALHDSNSDVRFAAASCVASRAFQGRYDFSEILAESGTDWRGNSGGKCIVPGTAKSKHSDPVRDLYLMRVAWPEMTSSGLPTDLPVLGLSIAADARPLQMAALDSGPETPTTTPDDLGAGVLPGGNEAADAPNGTPASPGPTPTVMQPGMRGSVSAAVTDEFEDKLGGILIKAVARTALKYELARGIEKEVDKKNEILGEIAFLTANAAAALFERADTRSWHLLPDELSVVRLRLPPGVHPLTLEVETGQGDTRLIDLGEVNVRDGSVHVVSARVWP
jgi:tetratricopeptide (TPR) repeat protein